MTDREQIARLRVLVARVSTLRALVKDAERDLKQALEHAQQPEQTKAA